MLTLNLNMKNNMPWLKIKDEDQQCSKHNLQTKNKATKKKYQQRGEISDAPSVSTDPASHVAPVVYLVLV